MLGFSAMRWSIARIERQLDLGFYSFFPAGAAFY
jgi:hypothetical protein